jgi:preprotein translocase subunit SecD
MKELRWKYLFIGIIAILSILGIVYKPLNKGLDLQGGMHLVLLVKSDDAIKSERDRIMDIIQEQSKKKDITVANVTPIDLNGLKVTLTDGTKDTEFRSLITSDFTVLKIESTEGNGVFLLRIDPAQESELRDQSVRQALDILRNRVDEFGLTEPVVQREGLKGERIIVELPGVDDPNRVKNLLQETAALQFEIVVERDNTEEGLISRYKGELPPDTHILPAKPIKQTDMQGQAIKTKRGEKPPEFFLLKKHSPISGSNLRTARRGTDQYGLPRVDFEIKRDSANAFGKFTGENKGQRMAIILDNKVMSAPTIQDAIYNAGVITGNFSVQEAEDLALVLRTGALPASLEIFEERTVGPMLGKDSINKGLYSSFLGALIVVAFMLVYYKLSGVNAIFALTLNILIIFAVLAYFNATLTLPGIAGIALTIGMAVDANILIFERIKEELALGKTVRSSIEAGFARAFVTIIDTNLTTILGAIFLYMFGTGPVRGFALTLTIGLLANMWTAVYVSKVMYDTIIGERKVQTLSI